MLNFEKIYVYPKSIIKKGILPDTYFLGKYRFSPYQACGHACKYCDGRAEKYYVEGNFEKDIRIRKNAPDLLVKELTSLREIAPIRISSGISDAYQPLEKTEKLTLRCAEVLSEYTLPVGILTKSSLILRDIDIWQKIHQKSNFTLMVSLTFLDEKKRKIFEPHASPVEERLLTLQEFKKRKMVCGALMMPLIPQITDTNKYMIKLIEIFCDLKVDFIMPGYLTLRPGKQKEDFIQIIKNYYPEKLDFINHLYSNNRFSGNPLYSYRQQINKQFKETFAHLPIPTQYPHHLYKGQFPIYDEIFILLVHMMELYQSSGIPISPLKKSFAKYKNWLESEKKIFNRKRSMTQKDLENKLITIIQDNKLVEIIENQKLTSFIYQIIINHKVFDYQTRKLI
ncbi:MAG: hypothetical protein MJB14_09890 [Spirochaetes bacterium]|nr:hypothetical protein [Spirochaetota bacterium]